jgi:hypothetical protein
VKQKLLSKQVGVCAALIATASLTQAQSPITTVQLSRDQIALVRTAQGITTRISFQEPVKEIVCGDLYDATTGKGTFVVQRGDNDVFLKPITSKGLSNLFVKTGQRGEHIYSFDLTIVNVGQAHRVVNVIDPALDDRETSHGGSGDSGADTRTNPAEHEPRNADEILRGARQQANRIIAEADQRASDIERQASLRAEQEVDRFIIRAVMLGVTEVKIGNLRVVAKRVALAADSRILVINDKAYLRYTLHNTGDSDFSYHSVILGSSNGTSLDPFNVEVNQSKRENLLASGESLAGVIVFDPKLIESKNKIVLALRADEGEIARLGIVPLNQPK